jgi:hypothetical protein
MVEGLFQPWHLLIIFALACLVLGPWFFYIPSMQRVLKMCSPESRTMPPGKVWLLLIPIFSLVWHFVVVLNIMRSLGNELRSRNVPNADSEPGKILGLAMCALFVGSLIPRVGTVLWLAGTICWIAYWVRSRGTHALSERKWRRALVFAGMIESI